MQNADLAADYIRRARIRLRALDVLFDCESWADVVRESQEIVELSLKALLREHGIDAGRVHDVSEIMLAERNRFPEAVDQHLSTLTEISRDLRRDRELAFYGAEDLTPSGFYSLGDAEKARSGARLTVELVEPHVGSG